MGRYKKCIILTGSLKESVQLEDREGSGIIIILREISGEWSVR